MTDAQTTIIESYRATGRLAFHYPRKKLISLNGHKAIPVKEAIAQMRHLLEATSK